MPPLPLKPKNKARQLAHSGGLRAEMLAAWFLRLQGYKILAQRYKTHHGEIDLIAQRFNTLAFVEVKARKDLAQYSAALAAVNAPRISRAAAHFLAQRPALAEKSCRFDIIFLAPRHWPRHVKDAFQAR